MRAWLGGGERAGSQHKGTGVRFGRPVRCLCLIGVLVLGLAGCWQPPRHQSGNQYVFTPNSDSSCARQVRHVPERVAGNAQANAYRPRDIELFAFYVAKDSNGLTGPQETWYAKYVTGRNPLTSPSTDDLIQFYACKWGVTPDWIRAQAMTESSWNQHALGDLRTQSSAAWQAYHTANPAYCPNSTQCYESVGILQLKWRPNRSEGAGTEPLRWRSTAFNLDWVIASERFEHDNPYGKRSAWGDPSYAPLDRLANGSKAGCFSLSVASHWNPYPWGNLGQLNYCSTVARHIHARDWPH
jgi:hypothetical protein